MIKWDANFSIPNSGVQSAEVYADARVEDGKIHVDFYADYERTSPIMIHKEYTLPGDNINLDDYLLTLEDFSLYEKV